MLSSSLKNSANFKGKSIILYKFLLTNSLVCEAKSRDIKGQWVHKIGHTCTLMWFNDWFTNSAAKLLNKSFYFVKMTCQRILLCYKKGGTTKKLVTMMIRWKKIKVNLSMNRGTIMTRHNNNNPDKELNVDLTFLLTACC